jgi:MFS family permease
MMTSLCKNLWEVILAQGIGMGLGMGMIFVPAVSCVSHWFRRRRALANGVLAAGSSIGGVTFPIMLNNMANNPKIGFAWAVRTTVSHRSNTSALAQALTINICRVF